MSEVLPQGEQNTTTQSDPQKRPSRRFIRIAGLLLIILSVAVGWFLLIGYLGWRSGEQLLVEQQAAALAEQLSHQKELAATDILQQKYDLALRRLEWVMQQTPNDQEALNLQQQAANGLSALLTPTPFAAATSTPTPTSEAIPSEPVGTANDPETDLQQIRRLMATKAYQEAISAIVTFQINYPETERLETDRHLYDAYIGLGLDLLEGEDVELGMFYLAQAAKLGDLPQSVQDYQTWAELYLQGVAFYGVNWDAAAYYYRDLCLAAPFYQSSCDRLQEVLVFYGDQLATAQEWCPAQEAYEEAAIHQNNGLLVDKIDQAREACLLATPTPDVPTESITNTLSITSTSPLRLPDSLLGTSTPTP